MVKLIDSQTKFENILDYYISCIEKEAMRELSLPYKYDGERFFTSIFEKEEYFLQNTKQVSISRSGNGGAIFEKYNAQVTKKTIFYGYPICVTDNGDVSPIFFMELLYGDDKESVYLTRESVQPEFNHYILKNMGIADEELLNIREEINDTENFQIKLEKILEALSMNFTPSRDLDKNPITKPSSHTILNKAMLFFGERTSYSRSLLLELNSLKKKYNYTASTSLNYLIRHNDINADRSQLTKNMLEIFPLNESQEKAVRKAIKKPITVITGPPGTGKSQGVTNIIANALWEDKTVLFASKNNRAVDVVFEKFEKLYPDNHIVRMGNEENRKAAKERMVRTVQQRGENKTSIQIDTIVTELKDIDVQLSLVDDEVDSLRIINAKIEEELKEINLREKDLPDLFNRKYQDDRFKYLEKMNPDEDSLRFNKINAERHSLQENIESNQRIIMRLSQELKPPTHLQETIDTFVLKDISLDKIHKDVFLVRQHMGLIAALDCDIAILEKRLSLDDFDAAQLKSVEVIKVESKQVVELRNSLSQSRQTKSEIGHLESNLSYYKAEIDKIVGMAISPKLADLSIHMSNAKFRAIDIKKDYERTFENHSFLTRIMMKIMPKRHLKNEATMLQGYLAQCTPEISHIIESDLDYHDSESICQKAHQLMRLRQLSDLKREESEYLEKLNNTKKRHIQLIGKITSTYKNVRSSIDEVIVRISNQYFTHRMGNDDLLDNLLYIEKQCHIESILKEVERLNGQLNKLAIESNVLVQAYITPLSEQPRASLESYIVAEEQHPLIFKMMAIQKQILAIHSNMAQLKTKLMQNPSLYELNDRRKKLKKRKEDISLKLLRDYWENLLSSTGGSLDSTMSRYFDTSEKLSRYVDDAKVWASLNTDQRDSFTRVTKAFPIWIVTNLSAKQSVPLEPGIFDLVVIDEASQCDIPSALPLLYRAKQAVIIGDPNQLKHISNLADKVDKELAVKTNCAEYYSDYYSYSKNSIFDLMKALVQSNNIEPTLLNEHFRSHPDIIGFSNEYFYENKLQISTDENRLNPDNVQFPKGVKWINVQGKLSNKTNRDEAREVINVLKQYSKSNLKSCRFGIVTLFKNQSNLLVTMELNAPELKEMDITVGTAHKFQGDERDIIIFSPGISTGVEDFTLGWVENTKQLLNVAVSRAKSTLVVVGDRDKCLEVGGILGELVKYADSLGQREITFDSPIEKELYDKLLENGIKVVPQHRVKIGGAYKYRLDFARFVGLNKYDIEIDGAKAHAMKGESDALRDLHLRNEGWNIRRFLAKDVQTDMGKVVDEIKRLC